MTQIDNTGADMAFLDEQRWQGKIFDGTWRRADGGERPVVEPATGDKLGTVGFAALSDLERSALRAREYVDKLAATADGLTVGNPPPTTSI